MCRTILSLTECLRRSPRICFVLSVFKVVRYWLAVPIWVVPQPMQTVFSVRLTHIFLQRRFIPYFRLRQTITTLERFMVWALTSPFTIDRAQSTTPANVPTYWSLSGTMPFQRFLILPVAFLPVWLGTFQGRASLWDFPSNVSVTKR